ncbi:MAG: tetratricopeptide repeat protein [bacterium]|nr:tetratricopeptide repeat protein [bacterium]MDT8367281.1 tetratricopeptide repeat protein [bacterium]
MRNPSLKCVVLFVFVTSLSLVTACQNTVQKLQKHLADAQNKIEAGDFEVARIELLNAIKIQPSSSQAYFLLGQVLVGLRNYNEAARAYANANELAPEDRDIALEYSQLLMRGNAHEMAEPVITEWAARSPEDQDFLVLLSLVQVRSGRQTEALDTAQKIIELSPDSAKAWLHLAQVNLIIGDISGAEDALSKAEEIDPASMDAGLIRVSLLQGKGLLDEATDRLELLARENPERSDLKVRLALLYERVGRKDDAIKLYREMSEREPNAPALYRLGLMLYDSGQKGEAVQLWEQSIETDSYFPGPRLSLARHYWSEKDIQKAMGAVNDALKYAPSDSEALALRGVLNMAGGNAGEALSDFQKALDSRPDSLPLRLSLAQAQLGGGEPTQARENLKIIAGKYPDHAQANLLLAKIEANAGNFEASSGYARTASSDKNLGREAMWILGDNALRQGRLSEAKAVYERNVKRHGDHPGSILRVAQSREMTGELEKAEAGYRFLVKERPEDILPVTYLVSLLGRTGRKEEALAQAREGAAKGGVPQRLLLGRVLEGTGNIEEARELYLALTRSHPDLMSPYQRIVALYARESKLDEAERWLIESTEASGTPSVRLLFLLGMVQDVLGKKEVSVDSYREVLELDPGFVPAINNLAWNLSESGDLKEALELAARGRKIVPDDPSLGDTYAWILHKSGDSAGALPILRQALDALPENEVVRGHLVEVLKAVGRNDEAAEQQEMLDRLK